MTGMSNDVPEVVHGAVRGQPCSNYDTFIFGQGSGGQCLVCASGDTASGQWVMSVPIIGTRPVGSTCTPGFSLEAQSPDGRGLSAATRAGCRAPDARSGDRSGGAAAGTQYGLIFSCR
jgi:hypothetical protein